MNLILEGRIEFTTRTHSHFYTMEGANIVANACVEEELYTTLMFNMLHANYCFD